MSLPVLPTAENDLGSFNDGDIYYAADVNSALRLLEALSINGPITSLAAHTKTVTSATAFVVQSTGHSNVFVVDTSTPLVSINAPLGGTTTVVPVSQTGKTVSFAGGHRLYLRSGNDDGLNGHFGQLVIDNVGSYYASGLEANILIYGNTPAGRCAVTMVDSGGAINTVRWIWAGGGFTIRDGLGHAYPDASMVWGDGVYYDNPIEGFVYSDTLGVFLASMDTPSVGFVSVNGPFGSSHFAAIESTSNGSVSRASVVVARDGRILFGRVKPLKDQDPREWTTGSPFDLEMYRSNTSAFSLADSRSVRVTGTDGVLSDGGDGAGTGFDAASHSNWATFSPTITTNDVVVITSAAGGAVNGTYAIKSISADKILLARSAGSNGGTCSYSIQGPKIFFTCTPSSLSFLTGSGSFVAGTSSFVFSGASGAYFQGDETGVLYVNASGNFTMGDIFGDGTYIGVQSGISPGMCSVSYNTATLMMVISNVYGGDTPYGMQVGLPVEQIAFYGGTPIDRPSGAAQNALTNNTGGAADGTLEALTNNTAGTADGTLEALTSGVVYATDVAAIRNNFTELFTQNKNNFTELHTLLNAIRTALVNLNLMKGGV